MPRARPRSSMIAGGGCTKKGMAWADVIKWVETYCLKLADDCVAGDFTLRDGAVAPSDAPGFAAAIDLKKLRKFMAA